MVSGVDHLVVGAGFFGSVVAERLAAHGRKVLVIDRRPHVGGNSWSAREPETGIEYHPYGIHVFHTASPDVMDYLNRFSRLNAYRHRVFTVCRGRRYPLPINLETINAFFGTDFSPEEARDFLREKCAEARVEAIRNLEDKALSLLGRELYEAFVRGYTAKQWGRDPRELPSGIISRLPVRFDAGRDYFHRCRWQGIPEEGYARLFGRMLRHDNIRVETGVDFREVRDRVRVARETVYTGPVDDYFDSALGPLDWRSIRSSLEVHPVEDFQGAATVNYADAEIPQTRIHEPKHLHPERDYPDARRQTLVIREFPDDNPREPYYPVRSPENLALLKEYQRLAAREAPEVVFGGRLGGYTYLDMDMAISSALSCARSLLKG